MLKYEGGRYVGVGVSGTRGVSDWGTVSSQPSCEVGDVESCS